MVFFFLIQTILFGQNDTIQVSKNYKTILVLPERYSFSVNGKDLNFIESFPKNNSKIAQKIVLLSYNHVAPDKVDYTNYTIYTQDGLAYDFILKLVEVPIKKRWNIFKETANNYHLVSKQVKLDQDSLSEYDFQLEGIASSEEKRLIVNPTANKADNDSLYVSDKLAYIMNRCQNNITEKGNVVRYFEKVGNVYLWLNGIYYDHEELYFQFTLENKEPIDLDINFLKPFVGSNYKKSSSNQKNELLPLYIHGQSNRVKGYSKNTFFMVFEKFTLDRNKILALELDELNGNRNLSLSIDHQYVNRPKKFGK